MYRESEEHGCSSAAGNRLARSIQPQELRMKVCDGFVLAIGLLAGAGCAVTPVTQDPAPEGRDHLATASQGLTLDDRIAACRVDPRVLVGAVSVDTCVGADLFLRETFNGNGRSCATCHPVAHNFTVDPAFISTLPAGDPLFVAETNPALAHLEIPQMMRQFSVILENVDGFAPDPATHFVLRSVPHTLSLAASIANPPGSPAVPANRTGWSGDGAPGSGALRDFQTGAITQHYTRSLARVAGQDFRLATDGELDRIDHFMRQLGRLNELDLTTVTLVDAGAEAGRQRFLTAGCNVCHGNAGANAAFGGGGNRNFNTGVEPARNPLLAAFPRDGGFGASPTSSDGSFGDGTFSPPPLIEAADTGPFFHTAVTISGASAHNTDVATTIEEAIAFYDSPAFNNSPSGRVLPIDLTADEIDNIGRFLRVLNATFNAAMASKRFEAAAALLASFGAHDFDIQTQLFQLAKDEVDDALRVLNEVPDLGGPAKTALHGFSVIVGLVIASTSVDFRNQEIGTLRTLLSIAATNFGTNLTYQIGDGAVMF
jgi:mono/diheme cytochrome c family protein